MLILTYNDHFMMFDLITHEITTTIVNNMVYKVIDSQLAIIPRATVYLSIDKEDYFD